MFTTVRLCAALFNIILILIDVEIDIYVVILLRLIIFSNFIICETENNRARLANELVPESIIAVLKTHLSSEVFVKEACRYVRTLNTIF